MIVLLVGGPAVLALASLVGAVVFFNKAREPERTDGWIFMVLAVFLLLLTMGIGACYAVTCSGNW